MRLFLASESPRRRELLQTLCSSFTVKAAQVEEISAASNWEPPAVALYNAGLKAAAVAEKFPDDWVLAADTIVVLDSRIYGKPRDIEEAKRVLLEFSGRTHQVLTAVVLQCRSENKKSEFVAESTVKFRKLSKQDVESYLAQVPVLDKAGSYGIQEKGDMLVEEITGELENIIGLPVKALAEEMKNLGIYGKF